VAAGGRDFQFQKNKSSLRYSRPIVLSVAGFDPCGGAGVLADIKTFEQHQCLGMAVITAITSQVEDRFHSVDWLDTADILAQLRSLTDRYPIAFAKIGIAENGEMLQQIVTFLRSRDVTVTWDTILAATAGFRFFSGTSDRQLADILRNIRLITPNVFEARLLTGLNNETESAERLAGYCSVLLKGGHSAADKGTDYLYHNGELTQIRAKLGRELPPKHGSGCVLSAAITANLALGHDLETACRRAKDYTETILNSNSNLLAYHVA
jgi:hydroxymethylpyrimidine/phosphomethylpyrimidine kinase